MVNHFILRVYFLYLFLQWNSEHDFAHINSWPLTQAIIVLGGSKKIRLPHNQGPLVIGPTNAGFSILMTSSHISPLMTKPQLEPN